MCQAGIQPAVLFGGSAVHDFLTRRPFRQPSPYTAASATSALDGLLSFAAECCGACHLHISSAIHSGASARFRCTLSRAASVLRSICSCKPSCATLSRATPHVDCSAHGIRKVPGLRLRLQEISFPLRKFVFVDVKLALERRNLVPKERGIMGMAKLGLLLHLNRWQPKSMDDKILRPRSVSGKEELSKETLTMMNLPTEAALPVKQSQVLVAEDVKDHRMCLDVSTLHLHDVVLESSLQPILTEAVLTSAVSESSETTVLHSEEKAGLPAGSGVNGSMPFPRDGSSSGSCCIIFPSAFCDDLEHGVPEHQSDPGIYFVKGCENKDPVELLQDNVESQEGGFSFKEKTDSSFLGCSEVKLFTGPESDESLVSRARNDTETIAILPGNSDSETLTFVATDFSKNLEGVTEIEQPHLIKFSLPAQSDSSMARVSEWVSRIALETFSPDGIEEENRLEEADVPSSPPANIRPKSPISSGQLLAPGQVMKESSNRESSSIGAGNNGFALNVYVEHANRCARAVDRNATAVNLVSLSLKVVPAMGGFHQLKSLCLSYNSIDHLNAGTLPRTLHRLDLSYNRLTVIEGLRELTRLRILNLSHNRLSRIGHGLASCTSMRELYLASNKISEVEGLHRLLKLTVLDLGGNKLIGTKSLGQLAANYGSLQALNLSDNSVHSNLGEDAFCRFICGLLPQLVYLNSSPVKNISPREIVGDGTRSAHGRSNRSSTRVSNGSKKPSTGHRRSYSSKSLGVGGGDSSERSIRNGFGQGHQEIEGFYRRFVVNGNSSNRSPSKMGDNGRLD